jgi:hypothetical protein
VIQAERLIIAKLEGWPDLKTRLIPEDFTQTGTITRSATMLGVLYTVKKKVGDFHIPSWDVTNQTLPGGE